MTSSNDTLYKILTRKYDFCCLCHKELNENPIQIEDEIVIKNSENQITLKFLDILEYILDKSVYNIVTAFNNVCKKCTSSAVKSYKFLKTTKENSELINNCINTLTESLESCNNYYSSTKSMFITYDSQNFKCQHYYDHWKVNLSSDVLKRLNVLFDQHNGNMDIKTERNSEYEIPVKPGITRKPKRKHYADSIALKTSDMLHNKNDQNIIKCKACLKIYPSLSNLRNHFIRVHAPKKYGCSLCSKKFGSLSLVEAHETESHCTLVCKECGKTFNNRHSLKIHEIGHYLRIVCPDCGRVYKSQSTYKKHIDLKICGQKTRASPQNAKFTCDYCNKKYTQKVSLRVHIQYEHGNYKSHECKWCKKKFFAQSRLKAHIVKHTQDKKFSCTTCGGKFVSKESLLYHTRTHTGEKPFKCEYCDKRFLSSSRRTDHRKRHHSNVTFQCKVCNIKYSTQICLQKHMKIHDGQEERVHEENNEKVNSIHEFNEEFHLDEIHQKIKEEHFLN